MLNAAVWMPIPGFRGYEISDGGDARSFWSWRPGDSPVAVLVSEPHYLKPDLDNRGRKRFTLRRNGRSLKRLAHRLVLEAFVGPCPAGMEGCHENGDATDNSRTNLRWDTHSANLLDRRRHGTTVCGEMVNTAKLTAEDVIVIRAAGYPCKPLAKRYLVSETLISMIIRRKVWQHVK
jgi:hypothetical protein